MTNYFNAPPDHFKYDTHGIDLTAEREPAEYCAECGRELDKVRVEIRCVNPPDTHLCCSDNCRDTLRASLESE